MGTIDPTYPLFPIASYMSAALLLLILLTGFIRQSWNLGVCFLCFWILVLNLINGTNAVIWSDNADLKLYAYCDIVTHVQLVCFIVKPTATFIIIRRLYCIASNQSIEPPTKTARYWDIFVEWTTGLVIPLLVAGPFYYIVQAVPFQVYEGFGCTNAMVGSVLTYLLVIIWPVVFPLITLTFYYPKVAYTFYRYSRDVNRFLRTNDSVSRTIYFRIFTLASIDLLLTLPLSITNLVLSVIGDLHQDLPFYPGWAYVHSDWVPFSIPYSDLSSSRYDLGTQYFILWTSPVLAIMIFCLFGLTTEARASYRRAFCAVSQRVAWKSSSRGTRTARSTLVSMQFGTRPSETSPNTGSTSQPGLDGIASSEVNGSLESSEGQSHDELAEKHDDARQTSSESNFNAI